MPRIRMLLCLLNPKNLYDIINSHGPTSHQDTCHKLGRSALVTDGLANQHHSLLVTTVPRRLLVTGEFRTIGGDTRAALGLGLLDVRVGHAVAMGLFQRVQLRLTLARQAKFSLKQKSEDGTTHGHWGGRC